MGCCFIWGLTIYSPYAGEMAQLIKVKFKSQIAGKSDNWSLVTGTHMVKNQLVHIVL